MNYLAIIISCVVLFVIEQVYSDISELNNIELDLEPGDF